MGWRVEIVRKFGGFDPHLGMRGTKLGLGEETALQLKIQREMPHSLFFFSTRMSMKHFVSPQKMTIRYIFKRNLEYGLNLKYIDPNNVLLQEGLWQFVKSTKIGIPLILRLFVRDRNIYPYWKTYAANYLTLFSIRLGALLK